MCVYQLAEQEESGPRRLLSGAAFAIHSGLHTARSDILCAAHTHSIHGKAFSALGRELDMLTQDACAFYNVGSHKIYPTVHIFILAPSTRRTTFFIASSKGLFLIKKKANTLQKHSEIRRSVRCCPERKCPIASSDSCVPRPPFCRTMD